jgi:hypothetical protein
MNLPNLNDVEIPKRMSVALVGVYLVKDIEDIYMALIVAGIIAVGILCQTYTDVMGKKA